MRPLENVFLLPAWAADPDIAPHYWVALRKLVTECSESVAAAQLLLENWHGLGGRGDGPVMTPSAEPFRDFWPWYSEVSD